jgi:hypothetical protein
VQSKRERNLAKSKLSREDMRELMLSNFARLAEQAGVYISRMSNRDREIVLETALNLAFTLVDEYNPKKMSVLVYWDECLRGALRGRKTWRLRFFDRWESHDVLNFFGPIKMPSEDD